MTNASPTSRSRPTPPRILAPHKAGLPAVVLHCAMHCYRDGTDEWFKFCGVTSRRHGAGYPHEVLNVDPQHPIMAKFGPAWANPAGELYWIEKVWPTAHPLATSKNKEKGNDEVCVWTNQYEKARVFGTTLGHHNETVGAPQYLDLLTRGVLWAAGKLDDGYLKAAGGRPEGRPRQPRAGPAGLGVERAGRAPRPATPSTASPSTRWCASGAQTGEWLQVDLGAPTIVDAARLDWESRRRLSLQARRLEGRQGVDDPGRRLEEHDGRARTTSASPGRLPIRPRDVPRPARTAAGGASTSSRSSATRPSPSTRRPPRPRRTRPT